MDVVLFCCGDNFEEDLRWEPKLGVFVDLVELNDVANCVGVTLFKDRKGVERSFLFLDKRGAENKGRWGRRSWP